MAKYESIAIPFYTAGYRQYLTALQLATIPGLQEFVEQFRHCFEFDYATRIFWYNPPE